MIRKLSKVKQRADRDFDFARQRTTHGNGHAAVLRSVRLPQPFATHGLDVFKLFFVMRGWAFSGAFINSCGTPHLKS